MKILYLFLLVIFVMPATAALPTLPDNMAIMVMRANDGKILLDHRGHQAMTPASTTKILTAYMALDTLGPDYTFNTQIYLKDNDLWLRFSGDPSLKRDDLIQLLSQAFNTLPDAHINNIFIDHTAFSAPWVARGWAVDDIPWYYAAPVHGIILDENQWVLNIASPKQMNQPVTITSINPLLRISSNVIAVDTPTSETLCQIDVALPHPHHILLQGCWPQANPPQNLKIANQYPLETAQSIIIEVLKSKNITFQGKISTGSLPAHTTLLAEHRSAPLSELIKPVLQDSNNIYTESLTKTLGAKAYGRPTFQAGSYHIQQSLLKKLNLPAQELFLADGSGVSFLNLISANVLAQTLRHAYQNEALKTHFIHALSYTGTIGTLKSRLPNLAPPFAGKTGSMSHVSTLAGYHGLDTNNPLIYVIMVNHSPEKGGKLKQFEDTLLLSLINSYFTNNSTNDRL